MQFEQLDLNLLVALDALLTERNTTEAGRRVHITQSAMSGSLARLREYFDDEILVQVGRKMVPTPLATSLEVPVRDVLLKIKETLSIDPSFNPATSKRRFSLMMSDYVATVLMTAVLKEAERVAPGVSLEIVSNDVNSPFEVLEHADVDFLIMPPEFLSATNPVETLFHDPYVCLVWNENDLVGETLSTEQYLELGHVVVRFGRRVPGIDEYFHNQLGIRRRIEVVTMNFTSIPLCVVGTHRIAIVQRRLAEFYARYLPLRLVPPPFELPALEEAIQWPACFDRDPGSIWLRGLLRQVAAAAEPC